MSDFVYSVNSKPKGFITNKIQSIYNNKIPQIKEIHGEWGSLGFSENLYNGFNVYENKEFITIVLGGPLLMFCENEFINKNDNYDGSKAIFERWKNGEMNWDEDLSGPFTVLILNKESSQFFCINDLMAFIPVYSYQSNSELVLSSHVDVLAKVVNKTKDIDETSLSDFILHGVITYPFTMYKNIRQLQPASEHKGAKFKIVTESYWLPYEEKKYKSINMAATELRKSIEKNIKMVTKESNSIAQFISGGEDSRVLSGIMKTYSRDAFVFLDQMNREGKIAAKIAKLYGANFKPFIRDQFHYLNILPTCSKLVSSNFQYQHAHTYGFHRKCNLNEYDAVFGGLYSDALLKGSRIKTSKISGRLPFIPEIRIQKDIIDNLKDITFIKKNLILKLIKRRKAHLDYIQSFREATADEWFELWPSSMNPAIANLHANRRLFRSYEPFLANDIIKISASIPQKWKLNRRLFHKMAKPLLKDSRLVKHSGGWYPYYSWVLKSIMDPIAYFSRNIGRKTGVIQGNQGPWSEWDELVKTKKWNEKFEDYKKNSYKLENVINQDINKIFYSEKLNTTQKVNMLQILYRLM